MVLNKHFKKVLLSGTHLSAESTEEMCIKCLAQELNILMHPEFEPSIAISRNRHLTHMTKKMDFCK